MAKEGKQFEKDWKDSCPDSVYIERFKDSAMWGKGAKVTTSQNPCDYIMYSQLFLYLLEMKSTEGTSFSFSENIIKQNQIDKLLESQKVDGVIAGFLFNFRYRKTKKTIRENAVYFVPIGKFVEFKDKSGKSSINEDDCKQLGMVVKGAKKITHYKYDISDFCTGASFEYIKERLGLYR